LARFVAPKTFSSCLCFFCGRSAWCGDLCFPRFSGLAPYQDQVEKSFFCATYVHAPFQVADSFSPPICSAEFLFRIAFFDFRFYLRSRLLQLLRTFYSLCDFAKQNVIRNTGPPVVTAGASCNRFEFFILCTTPTIRHRFFFLVLTHAAHHSYFPSTVSLLIPARKHDRGFLL